jgi:ferrous iron transport protein B
MKKINIALAGNPNCGKTTVFNALTGAKQRVGNWPGVTVEHKEGNYSFHDVPVKVIDLPGIYSFSAYSLDEKVSRDFILREKPDVVVNVIDASNLERNLYLSTQLIEMKVPVLIALNMMDVAEQKKIRIEIEHLREHLDVPIIPIIASKKKGIDELKEHIYQAGFTKSISSTKVEYDSVVEAAINKLQPCMEQKALENGVDARWIVIKALEKDEIANRFLTEEFTNILQEEVKKIEKHTGMDIDIVMADGRYGFIHGLARDVLHRDFEIRKNVSDAIDKIVLNRFLSIPFFIIVMYFVFFLTIQVGAPFITFFDIFCEAVFVNGFGNILTILHFPEWLITLLADGIGGGIQTVATFIPPIFFMFLSLSFLEDSGYMSRAAFVMDRFMRKIGLPGKAFIPMLVGFGCNVPAIMATRTLENRKDRILTIMINPFMSCGARLPVYAVFASAFFARNGTAVIFSLYAIGILLAIASGFIFQKTILKGKISSFVMELPPYHLPTFNGIMLHTWQRLKSFIIRAGKVILLVVIILSFFNSVGTDGSFGNENTEKSLLSNIGKAITPIFRPMGISNENWPATVGLITGIFAKETVIGTLDALYIAQDSDLPEESESIAAQIGSAFQETYHEFIGIFVTEKEVADEIDETQLSELTKHFGNKNRAYAYLLFILIYAPCLAVIAAIYKELNAKWAFFSVFFLTFLAWITATIFYQTAILPIQPMISLFWLIISGSMLFVFYLLLRYDFKALKKDVQKEMV